MRILVFETSGNGHRFHYVASLLPALIGLGAPVTVAIPRSQFDTAEFRAYLAPWHDKVHIDVFDAQQRGSRSQIDRERVHLLIAAAERNRAEHVYVPSSDGLAQMLALSWRARRAGRRWEAEAGLHRGSFAYPADGAARAFRNTLALGMLRMGTWSQFHHVDVLAYEWARAHGGDFARRSSLLPDPIHPVTPMSKIAARRQLGIPEDGRYCGSAGTITGRKGIGILLRAFATASGLAPSDRLLLAGKFDTEMRSLLDGEFSELERSGRVVALDRFLTDQELSASLAAMDLVCAPYPQHIGIASVVLRAVAAGRPVLGSDQGWIGHVVGRLGLGWTCPADSAKLIPLLGPALERSIAYCPPPTAARLLEFHTPENFAASWTRRLRERLGRSPVSAMRDWDWVTGADSANLSSLAVGAPLQ